MKRIMLLSFLFLWIPGVLNGQDKVQPPAWNTGDKWSLTEGVTIMVAKADENTYSVKYLTSGRESVLVYEKSSLNRLYSMEKDRKIPYEGRNKRLFNFPLDIGKSWNDTFTSKEGLQEYTYLETFTVIGWEDIEVQAGKFRAVKLEYKQARDEGRSAPGAREGKVWYWYSPEVKYMVKCQYERNRYWDAFYDWELISFELKK